MRAAKYTTRLLLPIQRSVPPVLAKHLHPLHNFSVTPQAVSASFVVFHWLRMHVRFHLLYNFRVSMSLLFACIRFVVVLRSVRIW